MSGQARPRRRQAGAAMRASPAGDTRGSGGYGEKRRCPWGGKQPCDTRQRHSVPGRQPGRPMRQGRKGARLIEKGKTGARQMRTDGAVVGIRRGALGGGWGSVGLRALLWGLRRCLNQCRQVGMLVQGWQQVVPDCCQQGQPQPQHGPALAHARIVTVGPGAIAAGCRPSPVCRGFCAGASAPHWHLEASQAARAGPGR